MIRSTGWAGVVKNTKPEIVNSNNKNNSGVSPINCAYVESVNYTSNPGQIICNIADSKISLTAKPLNPNIKSYPIAGEMVILIQIPKVNTVTVGGNGPLSDDSFVRYISGINIWNNPSLNTINDSNQISSPKLPSYFSPTKIANIIPLLSFPGDIIYEGRFGNSIRLGNTNRNYPNDWSSSGGKGDPITIINNGQSGDLVLSRSLPSTTENLTTGLSSIYLTSYQRLSNFYIANSSFSSYGKENIPKFPSEYNFPQIVLSSNRIVLNAKKDHVIISGQKSVGLSSNGSVNIDSKKICLEGIDIKIGSSRATEPALLGNETVELLITLTNQVKRLAKIASTSQLWPAGAPVPDAPTNTIGSNMIIACDDLLSTLNNDKKGIKSNFVKIR
jgi:hypothetical protein